MKENIKSIIRERRQGTEHRIGQRLELDRVSSHAHAGGRNSGQFDHLPGNYLLSVGPNYKIKISSVDAGIDLSDTSDKKFSIRK